MGLRISSIFVTLFILLTTTAGANEIMARNLILSQGCKGCHLFEGNGGTLGPALDNIGSRMKPAQIRQKLLAPKTSTPKSIMPGFKHLRDDEMKALVDFLASRK